MNAPVQQQNPAQANMIARQLILGQSVEMVQQIYSNTIDPRNTPTLNIPPRNVGLIKGFWVELQATVNNTSTTTDITLTDFNVANLLAPNSGIVFTDLNNQIRIQTGGWHLAFLNAAKTGNPGFGNAFVKSALSNPIKYGNNYTPVISAADLAHNTGGTASGTVTMRFYVPLAYNDNDLRGAIYANVVNATMNLQLTFNSAPVIASGDSTFAVYTGATGNISSITCTVYQHYLDQLPIGKNGVVILPLLDLSTIYEIKNTSLTGITATQDFPIPYPNFRDFLSTFAVYDQNGTRAAGTDINTWALQSANFTNLFKVNPYLESLWSRNLIGTDWPVGVYYFDHRRKPLSTIQYGNLELVLNAISAAAQSQVLVGFEDFGLVNALTGAGSLPGG